MFKSYTSKLDACLRICLFTTQNGVLESGKGIKCVGKEGVVAPKPPHTPIDPVAVVNGWVGYTVFSVGVEQPTEALLLYTTTQISALL